MSDSTISLSADTTALMQAHAANDSIIQGTSSIGEQISEQTKAVKDFGSEQSKVAKEISKALETQSSQQKEANSTAIL